MEVFNWTEIKDKYPELFDLYCNDEGVTDKFVNLVNYRNLYDFFDRHGIMVNVSILYSSKLWNYGIFNMDTGDVIIYNCENSRKEAELAVFLKAFEILNDKLK